MAIAETITPGLRKSGPEAGPRGRDRRLRRSPSDGAEAIGWTASWTAWGTTASVTVTDPGALVPARRIVSRQFAAAEKAAARFRPDAELHKLYRAGGRTVTISPMLAELVSASLVVAERTGGDVDPTVGAAMTAVHSAHILRRRERSGFPACGSRPTSSRPAPGWEQVHLLGRRLQVPAGTTLDLTATAKAFACDRAAARVRERLDTGVLVRLGADAASAGPAPDSGWIVTVADRGGQFSAALRLPSGAGLATSHLTVRPPGPGDAVDPERGTPGHFIDPHTGQPPTPVWRMTSAIGFSSLEAATYCAAALVRGTSARGWLTQLWVPARLITIHDDPVTTGSWNTHVVTAEPLPSPRRTTL
jgi:thiamine biosynthesis lipoprotein